MEISVPLKMCFPRYHQDRRKTLRATLCQDASSNHVANASTVQLFLTLRCAFCHQMEPFLNLFDLTPVSIWKRAHRYCLKGKVGMYLGQTICHSLADQSDLLLVTPRFYAPQRFKGTLARDSWESSETMRKPPRTAFGAVFCYSFIVKKLSSSKKIAAVAAFT